MFVGTASAALTYVDADHNTNTGPASAFTAADAADDLWRARAGFGTNDTIYESSGNPGAEDSPEIVTTITGLDDGKPYNVYAHFYDVANNVGENWPLQAGFESGNLTLFANGDDGGATALSASPAVLASTLTYVTDPKFDDGGNRLLYAAPLGVWSADVNGEINVYIDDLPATIGANNRTWYDGVSYELVPEPASAILLGMCLVAPALVRRRLRHR